MANDGKTIITLLKKGGFYTECPCCNEQVSLRQADMFCNDDFTTQAEEIYQKKLQEISDRKKELRQMKALINQRSERTAQAVNIGYILERIAPTLPSFHFEHTDCRSIFDPIDYMVFQGMSKHGRVDRIIFSDIKTGKAKLSPKQKKIRDAVQNGKVEWKTYKTEGGK
jgi:predicted Holliday junction resolvase-like endonuclease